MDTTKARPATLRTKKKGRAFTRPAGTFPTPEVSACITILADRSAWAPQASWLAVPVGASEPPASRLRVVGGRSHARLHVVKVDHRLGDIDRLRPPQHRALRPRLRGIDDHAEAVVLRILHDHRSHLLQNAAGDFLVLVAEVFLGILHGAIENLLLALDLLLQSGQSLFVQLVLLRGELLLQTFEFVVLALQFALLGLELLSAEPRRSRRPSLLPKIASSMLMVPTLVPVLDGRQSLPKQPGWQAWRPDWTVWRRCRFGPMRKS